MYFRAAIQLLLLLCSWPAWAWGPAMHAYLDYKARAEAQAAGTSWAGLDLQAYLAGAPAPDIWYATEESGQKRPAGIEEDWEYVRLMFSESRTVRQLSFTLGYAGHIQGDVQGHRVYLAPGSNDTGHLLRDAMSGFVLFGAHQGYPHFQCPTDLIVGWGLDTEPGADTAAGKWGWKTFDDELVGLMERAAARWCAAKKGSVSHCPVSAATVRGLRNYMIFAVNAMSKMAFTGYYAQQSKAVDNAAVIRALDDDEFGVGAGPAKLKEGLERSVAETRERLFGRADIVTWIQAAAASSDEVQRFWSGPPPPGQAAREGYDEEAGCSLGPHVPLGAPLSLPALLMTALALVRGRRRGVGDHSKPGMTAERPR